MHTADAGFSITESVVGRLDIQRVSEALETADAPRTKAGIRNALRVPAVRVLAAHPDLVSLAATFIGERPIPFRLAMAHE